MQDLQNTAAGEHGQAQLQSQLLAQAGLAASIASTAVDNAGKLALLQLQAAREATCNAMEAWRHMLAWSPVDWPARPGARHEGWLQAWQRTVDYGLQTMRPASPAASGEPSVQAGPGPGKQGAGEPLAPDAGQPPPPPAELTPLAAAASEVLPGAFPAHPSAALPPAGTARVPLPRVKPMEAAPPPPPIAGTPEVARGRGRGAKK